MRLVDTITINLSGSGYAALFALKVKACVTTTTSTSSVSSRTTTLAPIVTTTTCKLHRRKGKFFFTKHIRLILISFKLDPCDGTVEILTYEEIPEALDTNLNEDEREPLFNGDMTNITSSRASVELAAKDDVNVISVEFEFILAGVDSITVVVINKDESNYTKAEVS